MTRGHQLVAEAARMITGAELARRAGTSPSMIRHLAAGRRTPGDDLRARLVPHGVPSDAWDAPAEATSDLFCAAFLASKGMTPADFVELLEIVLLAKPEIATALADAFSELDAVVNAGPEAIARYGVPQTPETPDRSHRIPTKSEVLENLERRGA